MPSMRELAIECLRERGPMTAFQIAKAMNLPERSKGGLYRALKTAVKRNEVEYALIEAVHFHSFQNGMSKLYGLPGQGIAERNQGEGDAEDLWSE